MEPVVVDLSMLLSEIYSAFHDRIRIDANEQLELIVDNSMEVPDCIMCDETRLKQVVYNLVSNSVKFTERGSIHLGYERKKGGMVEFYVADTGPGVPDDMRERIFKRFRQGVPSSGRRNDGVGLGLSICEGLVTLLGGKIWLEQNLPNGSVFRFSVRDQRDRIRPRQIAARIESKPIDRNLADVEIRKGSKILVAEDDDMNFHVIDEFLRKEKLVAMRAHNGEEAVSLVEQDQDIKLVVMDLGMPVLNGLEATKRIKLIRPELTVIAHTAHAMKKDLDKAIDAGCSDCLVKPISIERFKRMLARYA